MKRKILLGNWKMNLPRQGVDAFLVEMEMWHFHDATSVGIAPPFPFIAKLRQGIRERELPVGVAAQNCSDKESGAFTGEVSAAMVKAVGADLVIVGHSERRALFGESDSVVAAKVAAALSAGLRPVLCIGETLETREGGDVRGFLTGQLRESLRGIAGADDRLILAYEPVWAIGTGRNASSTVISETGSWIRDAAVGIMGTAADGLPLLYGGSVNDKNSDELAREGGMDGFLVGGACLDPARFRAIYESLGS